MRRTLGKQGRRCAWNVHLPELHSSYFFSFLQRRGMQRIVSARHLAGGVVDGGDGVQQRAAVVKRCGHAENTQRLFGVSAPYQLSLHVQAVAADDCDAEFVLCICIWNRICVVGRADEQKKGGGVRGGGGGGFRGGRKEPGRWRVGVSAS